MAMLDFGDSKGGASIINLYLASCVSDARADQSGIRRCMETVRELRSRYESARSRVSAFNNVDAGFSVENECVWATLMFFLQKISAWGKPRPEMDIHGIIPFSFVHISRQCLQLIFTVRIGNSFIVLVLWTYNGWVEEHNCTNGSLRWWEQKHSGEKGNYQSHLTLQICGKEIDQLLWCSQVEIIRKSELSADNSCFFGEGDSIGWKDISNQPQRIQNNSSEQQLIWSPKVFDQLIAQHSSICHLNYLFAPNSIDWPIVCACGSTFGALARKDIANACSRFTRIYARQMGETSSTRMQHTAFDRNRLRFAHTYRCLYVWLLFIFDFNQN